MQLPCCVERTPFPYLLAACSSYNPFHPILVMNSEPWEEQLWNRWPWTKAVERRTNNSLQISWDEIIKIWAEINEIEKLQKPWRVNKTKSWVFKKSNNIDKPLAKLTKERAGKVRRGILKKLEMNRGITRNAEEIQRITKKYFKISDKLKILK